MWDVMALVWDEGGYFAGLFVPVFLFFYIFPTGRFLTRRWAWAGWAGAVLTCMATLDAVLQTDIGPDPEGWTISNPIGLLETNSPILQGLSSLGLLLLVVGGVMAIITRYRRSEVAVRSQIKWVLFGLGIMLASFFGSWFLPDSAPDWLSSLLFIVLLTAIPVSVMVAINRYHLYDIERLISRTIGYAIVIATLALVYVAGAVWLPAQIIGEQSSAFVAGSTLVVASLLNPVRRRVISRVDQRFNRSRYDAQKVIAEFSERLKDEIDIDQITADSTAVISRTVQPESMRVWIRGPETGRQ
jgi:hypothetical protein